MLLPAASVTLIGLVVGVALMLAPDFERGWPTLALAFVGAWAGFLAGAAVGVFIDILAETGVWVAVVGHAGAVAGALTAPRRLHVPGERGLPRGER